MKPDNKYTGLEIAITGMSCLVPGAVDWRGFWDNLKKGTETTHFFSRRELDEYQIEEKTIADKRYHPVTAGLTTKDQFDAAFFDYTPLEAGLMNPANRIFHQSIWEALEDAGYNPDKIKGPVGIYAGAGDDSNWILYARLKNRNKDLDDFSLNNIANKDFLAALVSYKLNLKGPVVSINTTCSTSLVTISQACKSLLLGEAEIALAGGITIRSERQLGYFYTEGLIFSADGHCRAFDKDASGTVATEGGGIVVLKRLNKAIEDGDHIYAIIKGGAVNNDGNRKVGFMATSLEGQVDCIRKAHKFAKVTPETITYVEAHGTGTRLGDPIEVEALKMAFNNNSQHRCALGSVKTNIGHLDTAAGVAGLMKTALCLKHRLLPASLNYSEANPEIDFSTGPFYVNTTLQEWKRQNGLPLRAGVSSFGIGGTNAHMILEEAPELPATDEGRPYKLLGISARTSQSVIRYLEKLKKFVSGDEPFNLADLCYTLHTGRKAFGYRVSAVFRDKEELLSLLESGQLASGIVKVPDRVPAAVFLFSGQGSQYAGMSKDLYEQEPVFRTQMDEGFALLEQLTGTSFKTLLFGNSNTAVINNTRYAQPLIFLVEYSLAMLLRSLGVTPQYLIGHSIGEYVAACVSGVFSFADGLKLVVKRGELMSNLAEGCMLSIPLTEQEVQPYISADVSLAAVNGPSQVVLSGTPWAMEVLKQRLEKEEIPFVQLHTSHAFHSGMMDPVKAAFRKELEQVTFQRQNIPVISNLTGTVLTDKEVASPDYWVRHLREAVRFSAGIATLLSKSRDAVFVEVGAGHSLVSLLRQQHATATGIHLLRGVKDQENDEHFFSRQLGRLWAQGLPVDWDGYYQGQKRGKMSLPTYSFEPVKYPTEVDPFAAGLPAALMAAAGEQPELKNWLYFSSWKRVPLVHHAATLPGNRRVLLFFSFNTSFSGQLKEIVSKDDAASEMIEVIHGTTYEKISTHHYILDPGDAAQYDQLLTDLAADNLSATAIIYGWGIDAGNGSCAMDKNMPELQRVYFGLVYLVQALRRHNVLKERQICVLTDRLHRITGQESGSHGQSLLLGLVNVLPQEYSVTCFNMDISLEEDMQATAKQLNKELLAGSGDRIIGIRHGYRWVKIYEKNKAAVETDNGKLQRGGVYLVTGGLGNVGYILSRYLLETYNATIIITGRQSETLLQKAAQEHYDILKELGGEMHYYRADVSDPLALEQTVVAVEERFGRIAGVIHTAGIISDEYFELVEDMTKAKVLALFQPKVAGVQSIHKVFAPRSPDFVWLTSSLSSVLGGLGFGAYAAANLYMDHFVASLSSWRSIGLGDMAFSEQDIERESGRSRYLMKPDELCRLFEWSLGVEDNSVIIQTVEELSARIHKVYEVKKDVYLDDDDPGAEQAEMTERPGLTVAYQAPATTTETRTVQLFERFFSMSGIGVNDNFFDLGGDSLKAMMLLKRIKNEFDINITLTDFFSHDTAGTCAALIDERKAPAGKPQRTSRIII